MAFPWPVFRWCFFLSASSTRPNTIRKPNALTAFPGYATPSSRWLVQVRLSIFPAGINTSCARQDSTGHANDNNTGDDAIGCLRNVSLSSSKEPRLAGSNPRRRPRGSGNTDGYASDSSKQSAETDEAVVALRRAGGYDLTEGLQGVGLLFVRYDRCSPTFLYFEYCVVLEGLFLEIARSNRTSISWIPGQSS